MRILLVEDEQKTGDYLKQGLSEAGYITDWVTDGLTGKHQALSEEYDLIILDVMLPVSYTHLTLPTSDLV